MASRSRGRRTPGPMQQAFHGQPGRKLSIWYIYVAMIVLSGADGVLAESIRSPATVIIEGDRISDVVPGSKSAGTTAQHHDLSDHFIVPGFVDVHVHGV